MAPRSKPATIEWPLSAEQADNINAMFEELYDDSRNGSLELDASQITSGILPISRGGAGDSGTSSTPGTNEFTDGSLIFVTGDPGVDQHFDEDNANLFWDGPNKRLGIGTNLPSADLTMKAAGYWGFLGRTFISSPADGQLLLQNTALNDFARLMFGGTTASFPAIARNSANLQFVLADGSGTYTQIDYGLSGVHGDVFFIADATHTIGPSNANRPLDVNVARDVRTGGDVQIAAGSNYYWTGRSRIYSPANAQLTLQNNATGDFGRLNFGGESSSFPSLKRSSAELIVRLADDSADAVLQCLRVSTNNAATFHTSRATLTDGAGASAGTLGTAPAAGDPTKWIGIDDNGTTRYIPAW